MLRPASKRVLAPRSATRPTYAPGASAIRFTVLSAASLLFAWFAYRHSHLEWQGVDIAHHALMIDQYTDPTGAIKPLDFLDGYPRFSHRVTSWLLPLFSHEPVWTMRAMAILCIALMYLTQWHVLASLSDSLSALLGVASVQFICVLCKVGTASHFFPDGLYNFSRAVGGVGLWASILLLALPPRTSKQASLLQALAIAAASFALACHSAPGAIAFLGLGLTLLIRAIDKRSLATGAMLILAVIAGTYLVFGAGISRLMASHADLDGWMPVAHWPVLLAAVPTGVYALARTMGMRRRRAPTPNAESVLTCFLFASLTLLAYAALGLVRGKVAPYAVKSLFFYTTPLALLLWATWLYPWWQRLVRQCRTRLPVRAIGVAHACGWVVAVGLAAWPLARDRSLSRAVREADPFSKTVGDATFTCLLDRSADGARRLLLERKSRYGDALYFDLRCPTTAYFASQSALGRGIHPDALKLSDDPKRTILDALQSPGVHALLMPIGQDPSVLNVSFNGTADPPLVRWEQVDPPTTNTSNLETP